MVTASLTKRIHRPLFLRLQGQQGAVAALWPYGGIPGRKSLTCRVQIQLDGHQVRPRLLGTSMATGGRRSSLLAVGMAEHYVPIIMMAPSSGRGMGRLGLKGHFPCCRTGMATG